MSKNPCFLRHFRIFFNLGAILAHQTSNGMFSRSWHPWGRINSGDIGTVLYWRLSNILGTFFSNYNENTTYLSLFYSHVVHIILFGQFFGTNFSWNICRQFWVSSYHRGIFCPSLCYFSRRHFWIDIFCQKIKQTQTSGIWRIKLKIVATIRVGN